MQREPDFIFERHTGGLFLPRYRSAPSLVLKAPANRPLELLALEDRVLYSAAPLDLADSTSTEPSDPSNLEEQLNDIVQWTSLLAQAELVEADSSTEYFEPPASNSDNKILVVVDQDIEGYQTLLEDIRNQLPQQHSLLLINSSGDGWSQLNQYLTLHQGIQQIHLFSHGAAGQLLLGGQQIDLDDLFDDEASAIWQRALAPNAELLLYGCNVAADSSGLDFATRFAEFSGADVAASTDQSGNGPEGDWELEFTSGSIESATLRTEWQDGEWQGLLATSFTRSGTQDFGANDRGSPRAVAMHSDGSFVMVWTDSTIDGQGLGIAGQRFDANGNAVGSVFQVNNIPYATGDQTHASIDMDASGRFVVAWTGKDGNNLGINLRIFNADGTPTANTFVANAYQTSAQINPSVSMADDGRFVVVWQGVGATDSAGVFARVFNSSGTAISTDIQVNTTAGNTESNPVVSMNSSGNFAVSWQDGTGFHYQRFDSLGNKVGNANLVDVSATAGKGSILLNDDNSVVVVWQEQLSSGISSAFYARYSSTDTVTIPGSSITSNTAFSQYDPSIAGSGDGDFVITWQSGESWGDNDGIYHQAYDSSGNLTSFTSLTNTNYTLGSQQHASVAVNRPGNFVVVWAGQSATDTADLGFDLTNVTPPAAIADQGTATEAGGINNGTPGQSSNGNVLANDTPGSSIAQFVVTGVSPGVTGPTNNGVGSPVSGKYGTLTLNSFGDYVYTPDDSLAAVQALKNSSATLLDSFTYTIRDNENFFSYNQITITINGANDSPTAFQDSVIAVEAGGVNDQTGGTNPTGNVLLNDSDPDWGDTKTITGVAAGYVNKPAGNVGTAINGSYGKLTIYSDGSFTYTVDNNASTVQALSDSSFTLIDTFSYTFSDGAGFTDSARLTVTIQGTNDTPSIYPISPSNLDENTANGSLVTTVSATDLDAGQTITFSLSDNAGGRFTIDPSTGAIIVADGSRLDFESAAIHTVVIRATDSAGVFSEKSLTISLTDVDEFDIGSISDGNSSTNSVSESSPVNAVVGITAWATDPDGTAVISYSLQDDAGGRFTINSFTGVVYQALTLDFESNATHSIVVCASSSDGSSTLATFVIEIVDLDEFDVSAISDTNSAVNSLHENSPNGTLVGITASASDSDGTNNIITYSLDSNTGGRFAIDSSTGVVTVADGSLLNYEVDTSYTIIIRATSSDNSFSTQSYTIALTDVDEFDVSAITDTDAASDTLAENSANGSSVGITASANDADATTNTIIYSLDDSAGGRFAINSSTGIVTVANNTLLNYEAATSHSIIVRATSADGSFSMFGYTINLTDVDEFDISAIVDTDGEINSLAENSANGTKVGITASANDADGTTNTIIYSLDDSAGGSFAINGSTGVISIADSALLNYEAATSHSITVRATSADGSFSTQAFTINLTDIDEFDVGAVSDSNAAANSLAENSVNGTVVGITASASDADATTNTITYSLDNSAGGRFVINSSTGIVTVADNSLLNYEAATSHSITVRATSADGSFSTQTFTISLTDVDEFDVGAVSDSNAAANSLAENSANGTAVGITASASDADATTNTITYSLDNSAGGRFAINSSTGIVTVADSTLLNYEAATSHSITVRATSADGSFSTQTFTINLTDVDEFDVGSVSDSNAAANSLAENSANGTAVGITASASDADATTNTITYSLDNSAGGRFAINSSTGIVTVADSALLNYEAATSHSITVRATSADGSFSTQAFTINLTDIDEFDVGAVSDSNAAANSLAENSANGTAVGITASASDADATTNTITYSLDNSAGGRFAINSSTGIVTVADSSLLNYEAATSHSITVRATSADGSFSTQTFTINLTDVDEFDVGAVSDSNATANSIAENSANGTAVGITASASDADATNSTITYSLDNSAGGRFAINSSTGIVTVADSTLLNYEAATSHSITVRATSADGSFSTQTFTINLTDVDEFDVGAVSDSNAAANSLAENSANGNAVGITASASDADATTNTITYSLDDSAGGRFAINSSTGVVTAADSSLLNYEAATSYSITVRATSADGSFSTQAFTINLTDVDEFDVGAVSDSNAAANSLAENSANGIAVGITASASDADATTNTITYSLDDSAAGRFAINSSTGIVTVANSSLLNYEAATSHSITVRATSADGSFSTQSYTILLTDENEAPIAYDDSAIAIEAGGTSNSTAGTNPTGNVFLNDFDPDNIDSKTVIGVAAGDLAFASGPVGTIVHGQYGNLTLNSDGSYSFTVNNEHPSVQALRNSSDTVNETFTYTMSDKGGVKSSAQLTFTIAGANDTPTDQWTESGLTLNSGVGNNQYIELNNFSQLIGGLDSFTLRITFTTSDTAFTLFSYGPTPTDNGLVIYGSDGFLKVDFNNQTWNSNVTVGKIADGERHELVISRAANGGKTRLYIDGHLAASRNGFESGVALANAGIAELGQRHSVSGGTPAVADSFQGTLWDFSFFNTDWNDIRVTQNFGKPPTDALDLKGYWKFDSLNGTILAEEIANRAGQLKTIASGGGWLSGTAEITHSDWLNRVSENIQAGSFIAKLSAADLDLSDSITWSLSENAGGRLNINDMTGVVTVANGSAFDRELAGSYLFTVVATDLSGSSHSETYTLEILDIDEFDASPIIDLNETANTISENSATGTAVGITASAFDADATNNTITYSLDNSAGGRFAINSSTGIVTVADGSLLNYEAASSHSITVRATSADGSFSTQAFTINLTDVDEFDVGVVSDSNLAVNSLAENSTNGTAVGISASASDADATNNTIAYSLDNSAGGRFAINSSTGIVTVANSMLLNYEAATSHSITVRATSADGSFSTQAFTINLSDVDEFDVGAISDSNAAANSLAENSTNGTAVGISASASDADATTNAITYSLDNSAGGRFAINSSTGIVTVANSTLLNYEAATSHSITVRATSADGSFSTQTFTINLTDVDEFDVGTVSDTNAAANSLAENSANGTAVGITASASDADATTNAITYSLDDSAAGRFAINVSTGVVTVANSTLLNYEAATSHIITVRATSADGSFSTQALTINLTDLDEFDVGAISDSNPAASSLDENSANGTAVGITASASDADATTNAITYSLDNSAGGRFAINSSTGIVTVANSTLLNYEAATGHSITVRATSADGSFSTQAFTINLTDVDEFDVGAVSDSSLAANSVAENSANGTAVGITASASDADATTNAITYSLDNSAGGRFAINSSTGIVTVANSTLLNYEAATSHSITVRATSADGSFSTQAFTINLTDQNEFDVGAISDSNPSNNSLDENSTNGTAVGISASAFDADGTNNTITYSLDDDAGGRFAINSSTGVVTVANSTLLNYEAASSHSITVRATSADGSISTQVFTINLTDIDEFDVGAVSDSNLAANSVAENSANGTAVGITASASDADATTNSITYSLDDDAGGRFAIDPNSGVLTVANGSLLDHEIAPSYAITVRATSNDGSVSVSTFQIQINNLNESPLANADQATASEAGGVNNSTSGFNPTGNVLTNDSDIDLKDTSIVVGIQAGTHAWTSGSVGNPVSGLFGTLILNADGSYAYTVNNDHPEVEKLRNSSAQLSDTFSYTARDAGGLESTTQISIAIQGANDAPDSMWSETGLHLNQGTSNNQYLEVENLGNLLSGNEFTLRLSLTTNQSNPFFFSYATNTNNKEFALCDEGAKLTVYLKDQRWNTAIDSSLVTDGKRHEIALVRSAADGRLHVFVDGVLKDSTTGIKSGLQLSSSGTLILGQEQNSIGGNFTPNQIFQGTYWDLSVHSTAWTSGKVHLNVGQTFHDLPDLRGHWNFELTSGDTVFDQIGTRHGSLKSIPAAGAWIAGTPKQVETDWVADLVENAANGTVVANLGATDIDQGELLTWSLTDNAAGRFAIDANTGQITVANSSLLNFEHLRDHQIQVRVTDDGGLFFEETRQIRLADVQEFNVSVPVDDDLTANHISENSANGSHVGIIARAIDQDGTNNHVTYSLDNDSGGRFKIDAETGEVLVADRSLLDRETAASHDIIVRATSEDLSSATQVFTIQLSDVNEFPIGLFTDIDSSENLIPETATAGTYAGITAQARDSDATNNLIRYSLDDDAEGRFAIDELTGVVTVAGDGLFDYESFSTMTITVRASSADGSHVSQIMVINLADINEYRTDAIFDVDPIDNFVYENSVIGTFTGLAAFANDADATNNTITYRLVDDDGRRFTIDEITGRVYTNAILDFETDNGYRKIQVEATSEDGSKSIADFAIGIADVYTESFSTFAGMDVEFSATKILESNHDSNREITQLTLQNAPEFGELMILGPSGIRTISTREIGSFAISLDEKLLFTSPATTKGNVTLGYTAMSTEGRTRTGTITILVEAAALPLPPPPTIQFANNDSSSSGSSSSFSERSTSGGDSQNERSVITESPVASSSSGESPSSTPSGAVIAVGPLAGNANTTGVAFEFAAGSEKGDGVAEKFANQKSSEANLQGGNEEGETGVISGVVNLIQASNSDTFVSSAESGLVTRVFATAAAIEQKLANSTQFAEYLSKLETALQQTPVVVGFEMPAYASAGASLFTVGYVAWLIRGGVLLTSFMSSLPSWQSFDPLPILENAGSGDGIADGSDSSIAELVDSEQPVPAMSGTAG